MIILISCLYYSYDYDDLLKVRLQDLYNNLDCNTYEVFETDPVKYIQYQKAIEQALTDKISENEVSHKKVRFVFVISSRAQIKKFTSKNCQNLTNS